MARIYTCFPNGTYKALTLSYDDGKIYDRQLVDILNKYHLKATFHLNSELLGQNEGHQYPYINDYEVNQLYKNHEVACHTCTHPTLTRIPKVHVIQEVLEDKKNLELLTEGLVRGLSYPNGVYNDEIEGIIENCGIVYSRTTKNTQRFDIPNHFLHWHPTCHHRDALKLVDQFINTKYDQRLMLFYVWGHSYEFERDQNWNLIVEFAEKVAFQEDVWYATNIDIYNYLKCIEQLQYSSDAHYVYNPNYASVWLNVDGEIKEIPGGRYVCLIK